MNRRRRLLSVTVFGTTVLTGYELEPRTSKDLATMPYHEYLQTPEWRERRRQAIDAAEHRCECCGRYDLPLHVHHLTYKRRGNEHPDDLAALCAPCHRAVHQILGR